MATRAEKWLKESRDLLDNRPQVVVKNPESGKPEEEWRFRLSESGDVIGFGTCRHGPIGDITIPLPVARKFAAFVASLDEEEES